MVYRRGGFYTGESIENTVTYQKPKKKSVKKVNIPATITVEGVTYQVTGIANNALKGCKILRKKGFKS